LNDFLFENRAVVTKFFELAAAISGSWYLRKTKNKKLKVFVYYLWLTVIVETLATYRIFLQKDYTYEWFIAIKNSVFYQNRWLYNIYGFLTIGLLGVFYSDLLTSKTFKLLIRTIVVIYSVFSFFYYTLTDAFFEMGLPYDDILASIITITYVICYFIELMRSEYILQYYKLPSFYISVVLLLWSLCVTPLFIFNDYFRAVNTEFVIFRILMLLYINILSYSCLTFGFWYSLNKSKQLIKSK